MATAQLYLDDRRKSRKKEEYTLKIAINHNSSTGYISLNVKLKAEQWDKIGKKVINHPNRQKLNTKIAKKYGDILQILYNISQDEDLSQISNSALCKKIKEELGYKTEPTRAKKEDPNTFLKWFDRFTSRKEGRTKGIYEATRKRLVAWIGEKQLAKVKFEDIKVAWLEEFEDFLSLTAGANANAIHFRNLRTVVNYAIDNEVTNYYAFRRYKIKTESTRKRNFDITTLRRIFTHTCAEVWQQKYLDFFKLSFMLIGINVIDLCGLKKITNGRVEYIRAKTHRLYSIKVESEAREIIDRYAGSDGLVNFAENYCNYRYFYNNLCKGLREVKQQLGIEELTTYWARHSWATIAHKLGVSKDIIAQALGHGGHTVTDIYIEEDTKAMDEANRKVLDYVLYGAVEKPV